MKTLENKKVKVAGKDTTYSALINDVLNYKPESAGFSNEYQRKAFRVLDVTDKSEMDTFSIEDADFEFLKTAVNNVSWGILDRELLAFTEYINSIK